MEKSTMPTLDDEELPLDGDDLDARFRTEPALGQRMKWPKWSDWSDTIGADDDTLDGWNEPTIERGSA